MFFPKLFLSAAILVVSTNAVLFHCEFGFFYHWIISSHYYCATTVSFNGSTSVESVGGMENHLEGKTNDDVGWLFMDRDYSPFFPSGIERFFKNLKAITIVRAGLKSISASDLQPFPDLIYVHLDYNNLTAIDGNLFLFNPRLQVVYMGHNQLEYIGSDLVNHLNDLRLLDLRNNTCISKYAETRDRVMLLALELKNVCPKVDKSDQCSCKNEFDDLFFSNLALGTRVDNLQEAEANLKLENLQQNDKIDELENSMNEQQQNIDGLIQTNKMLQDLNAAFEEKLIEAEKKLRELHSLPGGNEIRN